MEIEADDPYFLSDILGEGVHGAGLDDLDLGLTQDSQSNEEIQVVSSKKKVGAAKRKKNFHWKEDEVICSGWLSVSKDPVHGANQTKSSFWARIHAFYNEHNPTDAVRTASSIMHRWIAIQWSVNKFCSAYEAILRRNQSGLTIDDKIVEARKLYEEWDKEKKTFVLDHCWKILKGEDKWQSKMIEFAEIEKEKKASEKKASKKNARPREEGTTDIEAITEAEIEETPPKKRSDGIKKAKANMKRGGSEACVEVLEKMMANREASDKAKEARFMAGLELDKKRVANEGLIAEAKILKEQKDIMLADTSSLNLTSRAWIEKKQKMVSTFRVGTFPSCLHGAHLRWAN